jgi:hypothetical protein
MPTVADFGGYKIVIYFDDHNPPHVHVIAADFEGLVSIADGAIIAGQIPPKFRRAALDWIAANRVRLMEKWIECH